MASYIAMFKYVGQNGEHSPAHFETARHAFRAVGADLTHWYSTLGRYDGMFTVEAPDAVTALERVRGLEEQGRSATYFKPVGDGQAAQPTLSATGPRREARPTTKGMRTMTTIKTIKRRMRMALAAPLLAGVVLLGATAQPAAASFPGANGKIAFNSKRVTAGNQTGDAEIFTMNADGTGITQLTNNTATDFAASYSADGKRLVFVSDRDGNQEIYTMKADGTGQTRLTNNPANDSSPSFFPGGRIAFSSSRDGAGEIYTMNADGSGQVNRTRDPRPDLFPSVSADGTKIAFQRSDVVAGLENREVYTMNADGTGQVNRTNNLADDEGPSWSANGQRIAFSSDRDGAPEIYMMKPDGTLQTRLTANFVRDFLPVFSPDNTKVAFVREESDGNLEIYTMSAAGTNQTRLTNEPTTDSAPNWQPLR